MAATLTQEVKSRIAEDEREALEQLAARLDRSVSALIRRAIRELLAKEAQR